MPPDREQVRKQLRSGLTPDQVYAAMGAKRVYWLTPIEEEAGSDNELAAFPASGQASSAGSASTCEAALASLSSTRTCAPPDNTNG
jgi:hypothetical protein